MKISIIVAMGKKGTISINSDMPWNISEDLNRFRELTLRKPIIMGRKTHESIGKRLPERYNIVMTRNFDYNADGCAIAYDKEEAIRKARKGIKKYGNKEIMIIGGSLIYDLFLSETTRIYLTRIHKAFSGDTHFRFDMAKWEEVRRIDGINGDADYSFIELERK